jgi:hypothetical protein
MRQCQLLVRRHQPNPVDASVKHWHDGVLLVTKPNPVDAGVKPWHDGHAVRFTP